MKKLILPLTLILLASCKTLSNLGITFQLIEEEPRAPTELDTSYENFLNIKWSKEEVTPIINLGFLSLKSVGFILFPEQLVNKTIINSATIFFI